MANVKLIYDFIESYSQVMVLIFGDFSQLHYIEGTDIVGHLEISSTTNAAIYCNDLR